jgi:hypothetical protein
VAVIPVGLVIPDLKIPRWEPCTALTGPGTTCGGTPSALYRRYCVVPSHERKVWLCPVHVSLAVSGGATCRECAARGGTSRVLLQRITEPIRM